MSIKDNTNAVLAEANRLIKEKLKIIALKVERKAKQLCPVKTGTLRRSITHNIAPDGKSAKVGSNVGYAPYVEMGTSKMTAYAFLRGALEICMPWIKRFLGAR